MKSDQVLVQQGHKGWLLFEDAVKVFETRCRSGVRTVLRQVEAETRKGFYAAGFVTYEAASGLDRALVTHPVGRLPLLRFGIYRRPRHLRQLPFPPGGCTVGRWVSSVTRSQFKSSIHRIRDWIRSGDTYQVNYTFRLRAPFHGSPGSFFSAIHRAQSGRCSAYVDFDRFSICSASPELFFELDGKRIFSRPMKGTRPRGRTNAEDRMHCASLAASAKDRAENVMIVDMVRNDLGRVADPGSVKVRNLFEVEKYPTVLQLVSTVHAQTGASLCDIVGALFPCASITGAPKVRTMQIIRELEDDPRGVYTGAIGWISPSLRTGGRTKRRARFNVAIRTATIDKSLSMAEYGVGGGILWDSDPDEEYRECQVKARVLGAAANDFDLLETILWTPSRGFHLLERHLLRLKDSAEYFGFAVNVDKVRETAIKATRRFPRTKTKQKVRVRVSNDGNITIEHSDLGRLGRNPLRLSVARRGMTSDDRFLYHKTTNRRVYDLARPSVDGVDDIILWNERGEVTETRVANLVVSMGNMLYTPPVESGLLPGILRGLLLEQGRIQERTILLEDIRRAKKIWLINSVRGWIPADCEWAPMGRQGLQR